jgi:serine/threonine protein kinase
LEDVLDDAFPDRDGVDQALPAHVFRHARTGTRTPPLPRATVARAVADADPGERRRRVARRAADDPGLPRLGAVVGKYRIEEAIGAGGFAVVYRATHLVLQMPVAIKLLHTARLRKNPDLADNLWTEARRAAAINHPGVVRVYDAHTSTKLSYVVMEYIDGCTLAEVLHGGACLPAAAVLSIGCDVAAGLKAALARGLIHRDIKPSNILLTRGGEAKIVDLGLAQRAAAPTEKGVARGAPGVVGTRGYMAPEQVIDPERVDHRADIYALGTSLYEATCGRLPFAADDAARWCHAQATASVPPPDRVAPGVPARLSALLLWMLARQPRHRPRDYDQLIDALAGLAEEL